MAHEEDCTTENNLESPVGPHFLRQNLNSFCIVVNSESYTYIFVCAYVYIFLCKYMCTQTQTHTHKFEYIQIRSYGQAIKLSERYFLLIHYQQ